MEKFNIIYTSPKHELYLWDGNTLDKLANSGLEALFYSGRSIDEAHTDEAVKNCAAAVQQQFPDDESPKIEKVMIKVS